MMAAPPSPSNCKREPRLEKRAAASLEAGWDWKGDSPNIWASRGVWAAARVKGGYTPVSKVCAAIPGKGAQNRHRAKLTTASQILPRFPRIPAFPQDTIGLINYIVPYPENVKGNFGLREGLAECRQDFPAAPGKKAVGQFRPQGPGVVLPPAGAVPQVALAFQIADQGLQGEGVAGHQAQGSRRHQAASLQASQEGPLPGYREA